MKRFKKILLVDPPRRGLRTALKRAADLATRNEARLTVLGVVEPVPALAETLAGDANGSSLSELLRRERIGRIRRSVAPLRKEGVDVEIRVVAGRPSFEILQEVLTEGHDLVMMTAEGGRGNWLGSTATHLLRKCPVPVWVMKPIPRPGYASVLAAVDADTGDPVRAALGGKVLTLATSLARIHGADLHVVTAWSVAGEMILKNRMRMGPEELDEIARRTKAAKERELKALLADVHSEGLRTTVHLPRGPAAAAIPDVARRANADIVVMGTVGRTGIAGVLIGNTAEDIQARVRAAILAVKPDGFVCPVAARPKEAISVESR